MELRTFVKETLKDVLGGIHDAQAEIEHGEVVPQLNEQGWKGLETGLTSFQAIDFEVSVNAVEKEGSEAKLSVVAAVVGGHVKGDSSNIAEHTAKLSFKVPIKLPISGK
ncbi:hypothetical protein [Vibrio owensii]|uniref:Uncharacterized protein n=1 Tax=Vibrio owensii TaxID=696485 RepID=A0AAP9K9Z0_9VIBR|nr:hypothetical protein [Vibrio owensii]KGY10776.1 hypothetical protein NM22_19060 [Vibrio tubiashii]MBE5187000.1 hypothetical protein [Vibrio parahaemolyticus]QGH46870.1 hypothetical protein APZ19_07130 [Vibrio owensii]HCG8169888.1 hypothetical protein [Vibrio parahaemolyticus]HCG9589591.1 hypothetical protein [Vibrio parahaemolyticus]|eukprot:TRINITY_DN1567_c0_g2_i1.p12 TRINITY_DN1567_c0_g2~~TRINITY_DN1567_c0_g2_i1.p12  ORF type:complete len:109 (+),score=22.59 TRINITY_DN1567_c0_g2_i1:1692-2018(+)